LEIEATELPLPTRQGWFSLSGAPVAEDGSPIPLFGGHDIEMEGRQIFQARVGRFKSSVIDRLDIVMTFVAEIDTVGFFPLTTKK
jgi:hypothetical protein